MIHNCNNNKSQSYIQIFWSKYCLKLTLGHLRCWQFLSVKDFLDFMIKVYTSYFWTSVSVLFLNKQYLSLEYFWKPWSHINLVSTPWAVDDQALREHTNLILKWFDKTKRTNIFLSWTNLFYHLISWFKCNQSIFRDRMNWGNTNFL